MEPQLPYERQATESSKAFEAFVVYRDMGHQRSCAKVAQQLRKSTTIIERWSRTHQWVKRALAWDTHLDKIAQEQEKNRFLEEQKKIRKKHQQIAESLQRIAIGAMHKIDPAKLTSEQVLKFFLASIKIEREALEIENEQKVDITSGGEKIQAILYLPKKDED